MANTTNQSGAHLDDYLRSTNGPRLEQTNSRFSNNQGVVETGFEEYNANLLGGVMGAEGPSIDKPEHVKRFIEQLIARNIALEISTGNPQEPMFFMSEKTNHFVAPRDHGAQFSDRGFFDVTKIGVVKPDNTIDETKFEKYRKELLANFQSRMKISRMITPSLAKLYAYQVLMWHITVEKYLLEYGYQIKVKNERQDGELALCRITIYSALSEKTHTVDYISLPYWVDFSPSTMDKATLIKLKLHYDKMKKAKRHVGINCTAGLGRTGVLALAFNIYDEKDIAFKNEKIDFHYIEGLIKELRLRRPGLVQSIDQYILAIAIAKQFSSATMIKTADVAAAIKSGLQAYVANLTAPNVTAESTLKDNLAPTELSQHCLVEIEKLVHLKQLKKYVRVAKLDPDAEKSKNMIGYLFGQNTFMIMLSQDNQHPGHLEIRFPTKDERIALDSLKVRQQNNVWQVCPPTSGNKYLEKNYQTLDGFLDKIKAMTSKIAVPV